ncbi:O-acetyl-ADP-ribose deacetylase MACROD1 [Merluccius polli]|uniref:O-acetyl-ADP-ribose deacetylase MACROD1 n=1 Tax=Merluccius polli TaxID=89951 RepID=A0AA47NMN1_MERPO|nr:O-acetyl-ADP-ribose deacetylase MACROD1 [Merluccius polli]
MLSSSAAARLSAHRLDFLSVRNASALLLGPGRRTLPAARCKCNGESLPATSAKHRGGGSTATRWSKFPRFSRSPPKQDGSGLSSGGKRGLLCEVVLGALGLGATAALWVHTSARVAMAAGPGPPKVDLESGWKKTKDRLLSLTVDERRRHYGTRRHTSLDQIPVWRPSSVSNEGEKPRHPSNKKLDGRISLYTGDITQLEVDAIVNAGVFLCVCVCVCVRVRGRERFSTP